MDAAFLLKKILTPLVLPPTGLLLFAMLGLLLLGRWPRLGRWVAWSGLALLLVLSLPVTAVSLLAVVDVEPGVATDDARQAQAIVILGGGRLFAPEYSGMTVSSATLERARYGAWLARKLQLPVLVTGGNVYGKGPPEGEVMARALRDSFAVETKWIENRSRDTHENAQFSAAILKAQGIRTVLLVTHETHQRRALREFTAAGIKAISAPVSSVSRAERVDFRAFLPNASALQLSSAVLHEILGTMVLAPRTAAAP